MILTGTCHIMDSLVICQVHSVPWQTSPGCEFLVLDYFFFFLSSTNWTTIYHINAIKTRFLQDNKFTGSVAYLSHLPLIDLYVIHGFLLPSSPLPRPLCRISDLLHLATFVLTHISLLSGTSKTIILVALFPEVLELFQTCGILFKFQLLVDFFT